MSLNTDSPDAKKPCKGILKSSSSFDKHTTHQSGATSVSHRKSAKFDELNVLQTYHPPDKDYGHMKVDEPKTPFNYAEQHDIDQLDAELLAEKLRVAADRPDGISDDDEESSEEEEQLTEEQKKKKLEFERRRKAHYNEFEAIKLARKLIEEEHEDDDDDDDDDADDASQSQASALATSNKSNDGQQMEVECPEDVERKNGVGTSTPHTAVACVMVTKCGSDRDSDQIETTVSSRQTTRKSVISSILIISVVLTIFSMFCARFLFHLF
ncbi:protein phosphatase inhibitor 2 isoform X2 [Malaya genurostris]|uniref:protein phosphatase inhibitor 2 isoform X2 n=1 Tax=Malaya genurostris TaxID=325434 RepID=UPI0026F3CBAE|nr:protein phosphatase inhibitor 2 isoform X2 [Malaya genurostris]